jgi:hypothetical protein
MKVPRACFLKPENSTEMVSSNVKEEKTWEEGWVEQKGNVSKLSRPLLTRPLLVQGGGRSGGYSWGEPWFENSDGMFGFPIIAPFESELTRGPSEADSLGLG